MSFVQIGFLGALGALVIPILIHLVFRQRPQRVELGTIRFLRIVLEHNARRRRVMRWLLLSLRLACLGVLAFLFSRPYLLANRQAGKRQTVVILIDQSATMELKEDGKRAIDRAVTAAREILTKSSGNIHFEVAFFDHVIHPVRGESLEGVPSRELSGNELAALLEAPAVCHGATDYGTAMEWARDAFAKAPDGPRQLHFLSDFQRSGMAWNQIDVLPEDIDSQLHDLGRAAINNLAVVEARADQTWMRPEESTSLHVTVYNGGPFSANDLPVVLKLTAGNDKLELREQLKLEPGSLESLRFDLPPLKAGLWQGTVSIETDDDLPLDNSRPVALLASRPYQVLLLDGRDAASVVLASTYVLEAALRLAPPGELSNVSPFEPRALRATESVPDLNPFDLIVLSDVRDLPARTCQRIADRVRAGAGLLFFSGDNVTPGGQTGLNAVGLLPVHVRGTHRSTDLPLRLRSWDHQHPIFKPFDDPQLGDLQRLGFSAYSEVEPLPGAKVLAEFGAGQPALVELTLGKGSVLWFGSSCDRQWGDWTRSRLYLPLVYQLLGYQSGLIAGGKVRQEVLEGAADTLHANQPGISQWENYTLVTAHSPREAETDRCTIEEFQERFGLKSALEPAPEAETLPQVAGIGTELVDHELWPWLAVLLLACLLVESLVANRTAA